jgi:multiple sugar transport system ATP-binding protein
MNMMSARLSRAGDDLIVSFGEHTLVVDEHVLAERPGLAAFEGADVVVGIRPEDIEDAAFVGNAPPGRTLTTVCSLREALGSEVLVHFPVATPAGQNGAAAAVAEAGTAFIARVHPQTAAREGEKLELVVDTRRLHFFEPESGLAIHS